MISANYPSERFENLTPTVMGVLLENLPLIEFRRSYITAEMIAFIANALGGKQEPKPSDKPFVPFTPMDFIPFFARSAELEKSTPRTEITEFAAVDFLEGSRKGLVPDWVLNLAPMDKIRDAAKRR